MDWPEQIVNEQRHLRPSLPDLRVTGTINVSEGSQLAVWLKTFICGFFLLFLNRLTFCYFFFKGPEKTMEVYPFLGIK